MPNDEEKGDPSGFTQEELKKLDGINGGYCFMNSLVDFHESSDDNDDGSTIFAYTDSNRYM